MKQEKKSMKWLIISVFDVPSSHREHQRWVNKPRQCHTICRTVFFISLHGLERWSHQSVEQNTAGVAQTIHTAFLRSKFQLLTQHRRNEMTEDYINQGFTRHGATWPLLWLTHTEGGETLAPLKSDCTRHVFYVSGHSDPSISTTLFNNKNKLHKWWEKQIHHLWELMIHNSVIFTLRSEQWDKQGLHNYCNYYPIIVAQSATNVMKNVIDKKKMYILGSTHT